MKKPLVIPMGERAILVNFEPQISQELLQKVLFYKISLEEFYTKDKVEIIITYASLLIFYHRDIENVYREVLTVKQLLETANIDKIYSPRLFFIPVCYETQFAPDLEHICTSKNLSGEQVIHLHSYPVYTVYFLGFLPGFLYLGGLDEKLFISRKNEPRMKVEKGAVGIGENQTGIYPKISPGGWQIIGRSPVEIFDKNQEPPCIIQPGDKVKFYPVSENEFFRISEKVASEDFHLKHENYGS